MATTPARTVQKTPAQQEHVIPARYHGDGYHTNAPDRPLWIEMLRAIRSPCTPALHRHAAFWSLEYSVIESRDLATRIASTLIRHRRRDAEMLRHWLRASGLQLPIAPHF